MKTEKELLEIANKIAKESIFSGAEATGIRWKGLNVYVPVLNEMPCIGLPQFILLDDEGIEREKTLSYEETFEIMDLLPFEDDEPEEQEEV